MPAYWSFPAFKPASISTGKRLLIVECSDLEEGFVINWATSLESATENVAHRLGLAAPEDPKTIVEFRRRITETSYEALRSSGISGTEIMNDPLPLRWSAFGLV
jgi:hypothetical protein